MQLTPILCPLPRAEGAPAGRRADAPLPARLPPAALVLPTFFGPVTFVLDDSGDDDRSSRAAWAVRSSNRKVATDGHH